MVIYYSSSIFLNLGIAANISLILGGVASLCFWLGSLVGIAAIEKFGRKKLLLSGSLPMLIATCLYCAMIKDGRDAHLWVAFACTCVICVSFGWSWLPAYVPGLVQIECVLTTLQTLVNWC